MIAPPALRQVAKSGARQAYEKLTVDGAQAWFHPSSINAGGAKAEGGLYVYLEKVDTSRLFLRGTTRVPPAALLLFGAAPHELDVERVKSCGRCDLAAGARVRVSPEAALLLKLLRRELDACLMRRAADGEAEADVRASHAVVDAVRALLARH